MTGRRKITFWSGVSESISPLNQLTTGAANIAKYIIALAEVSDSQEATNIIRNMRAKVEYADTAVERDRSYR